MKPVALHIVAFDIPWPPNYGGAIDMYYKLKALAEAGAEIHLHAFVYRRQPAPALRQWCKSVHYYPRNVNKTLLLHKWPYIVISRKNDELSRRLGNDDLPILMEGLHTTALLDGPGPGRRMTVVRTHNVEHEYYRGLYQSERNIFRKLYFQQEATKLETWEKHLAKAGAVAALSPADRDHFRRINPNTAYIPAFHPFDAVDGLPGLGQYALYHGNLSVAENRQAAHYLIEQVFSALSYPLIIAGNYPGRELQEAVKKYPHIRLETNISDERMQELIRQAHIHVLPTFQNTGIKLKLLHALYRGRHVVVNREMVENTGLEEACHCCTSDAAMIETIRQLAHTPYPADNEKRKALLSVWDNAASARALIRLLEPTR